MGYPYLPANEDAIKDRGEEPIWVYHTFDAGQIIAELVRAGRFPDNSDLHIQSLPEDEHDESFKQAVLCAIGVGDRPMPEWALPGHELEDALIMISQREKRLSRLGTHYSIGIYASSLCERGDGDRWESQVNSKCVMIWDRLIDLYEPVTAGYMRDVRAEYGVRGNAFNRRYRLMEHRKQVVLSDKILHETVSDRSRLMEISRGIGNIARLGLPYLLFAEGGHEDMEEKAMQFLDYKQDMIAKP